MNRSLFQRAALLAAAMPFLYLGTASATYLYRMRAGNSARRSARLFLHPAPSEAQRLVIFSPHPDDETLGCGGIIRQARRAGAPVRVVMLTNGDGFRIAVERQFRELRVGPDDYVRFAGLRQQEAIRALAVLGLERKDITFLGYPDRGLRSLWTDYWPADQPYTSPFTKSAYSPYPASFRPGTAYSGQTLLEDITEVLREEKPTHIFVTHPSDDHPDHSAASAFVTLALLQLRQEGVPWARTCRLEYYLVHRGDWPVPQGLYQADPLTPPNDMAALDTRWWSRSLTREDTRAKVRSIQAYSSQTAVMKRFLLSFARRNEVFGEIPTILVPRAPARGVTADGLPDDWEKVRYAVMDPVNDNLLRDFQGGGDVKTIYACRDETNLYLRIDTSEPISGRMEFMLLIRYFGDPSRRQVGGVYTATIRSNAPLAEVPSGVQANHLELSIPLRDLGYAPHVALCVDTRIAGIQVDHTGYRFLELGTRTIGLGQRPRQSYRPFGPLHDRRPPVSHEGQGSV